MLFKKKLKTLNYYVDYLAPPVKPYDLIIDSLGAGVETPQSSLRYFFNYRRPIYDKKCGSKIGNATYGINGNIIKISSDKKSGKITGDFLAQHSFSMKNNYYDIHYIGKINLILGLFPGQTVINEAAPAQNIKGVKFQYVSAILIFKNNIKINSGENTTRLVNNGKYKITW